MSSSFQIKYFRTVNFIFSLSLSLPIYVSLFISLFHSLSSTTAVSEQPHTCTTCRMTGTADYTDECQVGDQSTGFVYEFILKISGLASSQDGNGMLLPQW